MVTRKGLIQKMAYERNFKEVRKQNPAISVEEHYRQIGACAVCSSNSMEARVAKGV